MDRGPIRQKGIRNAISLQWNTSSAHKRQSNSFTRSDKTLLLLVTYIILALLSHFFSLWHDNFRVIFSIVLSKMPFSWCSHSRGKCSGNTSVSLGRLRLSTSADLGQLKAGWTSRGSSSSSGIRAKNTDGCKTRLGACLLGQRGIRAIPAHGVEWLPENCRGAAAGSAEDTKQRWACTRDEGLEVLHFDLQSFPYWPTCAYSMQIWQRCAIIRDHRRGLGEVVEGCLHSQNSQNSNFARIFSVASSWPPYPLITPW